MRQAVKVVIAAIMLGAGVPLLCGGTILAAFIFLPLPASLPAARGTQLAAPSVVYDDQGNVIATFSQTGSAVPVSASQIAPVVKDAVVASEDHSFFNEGGVSIRGTLRALYDDVVHGQALQGGSTITQQFVKNAYVGNQRTLLRKIHEIILASEVSRQMAKDQILYNYLSDSYFGDGAYGVGAAAMAYFRTPVSQLDPSQAAMLAGVLPAPSAYDPLVSLADAESRRQTVLGAMLRYGYLNQAQYAEALSEHLELAANVKPGVPVTAVYPPVQETSQYPYFVDYLKRYLLQRFTPDQLYGGGLQIQSTLDPNDQAQAGAALGRTLNGTRLPLDMSLVSVEPTTGYVKALIGGRDWNESQVNLALPGCPAQPGPTSHIQVVVAPTCWTANSTVGGGGSGFPAGSSFKVFTLAAALEQGVPLSRTYNGPPSITIAGVTFHNDESEGGGSYDLPSATAYSINTVYVQLANDIGVRAIADMAKAMGVTSAWYSPQVHGLSYTLGVIDVSPLDMASAYSVLANQGNRVAPSPVVEVTDPTGSVLLDDTRPAGTRVLSASIASEETKVLEGVIDHGTAYPNAVLPGRPEAGKTGTTDSCTNAWFVGYTPQLSTAVWMGHLTSNTTPLQGVDGVGCVYGGTLPAKTWGDYMGNALQGVPAVDFAAPPTTTTTAPPNVLTGGGGAAAQISAGYEQYPADISSGQNYVSPAPPPPAAEAPTTTSTTSTTEPGQGTTTPPPGGGGLIPGGGPSP